MNTEISKPVMIIDQDNIPHGFCVSKCEIIKETNIKLIKKSEHSEMMAEKTKVWIEEILF